MEDEKGKNRNEHEGKMHSENKSKKVYVTRKILQSEEIDNGKNKEGEGEGKEKWKEDGKREVGVRIIRREEDKKKSDVQEGKEDKGRKLNCKKEWMKRERKGMERRKKETERQY